MMSALLRPMDTTHVVVRLGDTSVPDKLGYASFKSRILSVEPGGYRVESSAGPAIFVPIEDVAKDVRAARSRLARMMVEDSLALRKRRGDLKTYLAVQGVA